MAAIINQRDTLLLATTPRMLSVSSNFITVSSTTNTFSTTATGTSPSSIAVRASLAGELKGTVTWSISPTVPFTVNGNIATVPSTSVLPTTPVTVTASLTLYGQTYTNSLVLTSIAETVASSLTASAILVPTAADGTGGAFTDVTSTMNISIGTADNSTAWQYVWTVPSGVTATGQSTKTITVSDMTVESATLTCMATRFGWPTQTKTLTISKSRAGVSGTKTAVIYAYKRSATAPTGAAAEPGLVTYSFVSNTITTAALANSWQKTIPSGTDPLYVAVATAASTTGEDTVEANEWTDPVLLAQNGIAGLNTATVFLYARNSSTTTPPTVDTSGSSIYTFLTGSISGQPSFWSRDITSEANGNVIWVIQTTAANTESFDTIANTEWSTPRILAQQGAQGKNTALVYAYKRVAVAPSDTPGAVDYSFTTNTITTVTLANSWQKTIPSGTDPLYVVVATASSATTTDSIGATEWTDPVLLAKNGIAGLNTATVFLYARNNTSGSAPAVSTIGTSSYTFSNGNISGQPSGWTRDIPSEASGSVIWVIQATAANTDALDLIDNIEWTAPQILAQKGTNGANTALVYAYKRFASLPANNPGTVDYSFTTNTITTVTLANSWQKTIPSGTDPLYVVLATASNTGSTDTIAANEWSDPVLLVQNGTSGLNTASVFLYARNSSSTTAPTVSTIGTSIYTFSNGTISGQPSGWTRDIPAVSSGSVLWVIQATAANTATSDSIDNIEWSTPKVLAVNGENGVSIKGDDGLKGIASRIIYYKVVQSTSGITPPGTPSSTTGQSTIPSPAVASGLNGWTATAPTAGVGEIVFYSYGRYNPNPSTVVDGIGGDTTVWSTPIGASIFQDIKSDNWGSAVPANGNFNGATQGYYINRNEGSLYGSAIYLRGNSEVDIAGKLIVRGSNLGSQTVPTFSINNNIWSTAVANYGYVSENSTYTGSTTNIIRAAVTGYSYNQSTSTLNVGVVGIGVGTTDSLGPGNSLGFIGVGRLGGGWFEATGSAGFAIWAVANGTGAKAAHLKGQVDIYGTTNIIGYDLAVTGNISATGNVTAYSASDSRLKTNITRITNPLKKLRALGGYNYDWTPEYLAKFTKEVDLGLVKPHDVGVIAQEVLAQLPEAVNTRQDGTLAVNYEKLVPLLIEALLELDRRVN